MRKTPPSSADVLAHDQDLLVGLHGRAQSGVQTLGEGHLVHAGVPSCFETVSERNVRGLLLRQLGRRAVDVDLVEQRLEIGLRQRLARLAQVLAELFGLDLETIEELLRRALHQEVALDALDRVLELPGLDLGGLAVAGRVVGRRVSTHAVGVGLDQGRTLAVARLLQCRRRHGVAGQHVVAVDAEAAEPEAAGTLGNRSTALPVG